MSTMKPNDAAEVLRKLRERLESADQDFSDDERSALDFVVQELRRWRDSQTTPEPFGTLPNARHMRFCTSRAVRGGALAR
jgi:hypothetical protein